MVYEKICELLAQQLDLNVEDLTPETNILDDLGADSLDLVELITTVEDEFNLVITDERIRELHTIKEFADFVESLR